MTSVLLISPNWLGDFVMALPAVACFRREHPETELHILCKPFLKPLWACVDGIREENILVFPPEGSGKKSFLQTRETFQMGFALRQKGYSSAYLLPNSFRSAFLAWLGGIGHRRGTGLHARRLLVNDVVRFSDEENRTLHQSREYLRILCGHTDGDLSQTGFGSRHPALPDACRAYPEVSRWVGVIPGAARGDSKRWPHFAAAIAKIAEQDPTVGFVLLGTKSERAIGEQAMAQIGVLRQRAIVVNAIGETRDTVAFLDALCSCVCVLCNDSGGMHLASAAGIPVVAVFGRTDPKKTGPLGRAARIIQAPGVKVSRAIRRVDPDAAAILRSIEPERVAEACCELLRAQGDGKTGGR